MLTQLDVVCERKKEKMDFVIINKGSTLKARSRGQV